MDGSRALIVSSSYSTDEMGHSIGKEAYSYHFVAQAFAPLLERLGHVTEITRPESRLDYALWRAERQGRAAVHLSFLPLHFTYLSSRAPNLAFPSWEFPDIPATNLGNNPRNNWARIANHLSLIVCHSQSARNAFRRAGVKTPLRVIPIPVPDTYFKLPLWEPGRATVLDCPCFEFPQTDGATETLAETTTRITGPSLKDHGRSIYRRFLKPYISGFLDRHIWYLARAAGLVRKRRPEDEIPCKLSKSVNLTDIVYTTVFNPFDPRKNWQDLLTAFLTAFADTSDVTLVIKLVLRPKMLRSGLLEIFEFYRKSGLQHRCKVVLIWSYLPDAQMHDLTQASTYYLNTSRAEGSCMPLQSFLAAGRPGIAPVHSRIRTRTLRHPGTGSSGARYPSN